MGRPRIYSNNAERQAAFRRRKRPPVTLSDTPLYDAMIDAVDLCREQTVEWLETATVDDLKAVVRIAGNEELQRMAAMISIRAQRTAGRLLIELKEMKAARKASRAATKGKKSRP